MNKEIKTGTDFEELEVMKDEDIDCSDIPALTDEFLATAKWIAETPEKELVRIVNSSKKPKVKIAKNGSLSKKTFNLL
jgi:hypothetical protein